MAHRAVRILLVDDKPEEIKPVQDKLEASNFTVTTAGTIAELQQVLRTSIEAYGVVLIEYELPLDAGKPPTPIQIEMIDELRAQYPLTRFALYKASHPEQLLPLRDRPMVSFLESADPNEVATYIDGEARIVSRSALSRLNNRLRDILKTGRALLNGATQQQVFDQIVKSIAELSFDRVILLLHQPDDGQFVVRANYGVSKSQLASHFPVTLEEIEEAKTDSAEPQIVRIRPKVDERWEWRYRFSAPPTSDWVSLPLVADGQVIGEISADTAPSGRHIYKEELQSLDALAQQATFAIVQAELRERSTYESKMMSEIHQTITRIGELTELDEILWAISKSAVELFPNIEHSGLVLFEPDLRRGKVRSEYPAFLESLGSDVLVEGVPAEEMVVHERKPFMTEHVATDERLGSVRDLLVRLGIRSILIVPLIHNDRVLGSFSFDTLKQAHRFSPSELKLAQVYASHVAVLVANAQLRADERTLQEAALAMNKITQLDELLLLIAKSAARFLQAESGGIYGYNASRGLLTLLADSALKTQITHQLKLGESMAGHLVKENLPYLIAENYDESDYPPAQWDHYRPFEAVVEVPLRRGDDTLGVLFVDTKFGRRFTTQDVKRLQAFAAHAASAIHRANLLSQARQFGTSLDALHYLGDVIEQSDSSEKILRVVATGITASFGLRFNRIAIFLVNRHDSTLLQGRFAIGQMTYADAEKAWKEQKEKGFDTYQRYLDALEQGGVSETVLNSRITPLQFRVGADQGDKFSEFMRASHCKVHILDTSQIVGLPSEFTAAFEPDSNLYMVPLIVAGRCIGIVAADNKYTQEQISERELRAFVTFVTSAAVAIDRVRLIDERKAATQRISNMLSISNQLLSELDRNGIEYALDQMRISADASGATFALMDRFLNLYDYISTGIDRKREFTQKHMRPNGFSFQVYQSDEPRYFPDIASEPNINPEIAKYNCQSAACIPVRITGKPIGVAWLHFQKARKFEQENELNEWQLMLNQIAVAYLTVARMRKLSDMTSAIGQTVAAQSANEILNTLVLQTRRITQSDASTLLLYDHGDERFVSRIYTTVRSDIVTREKSFTITSRSGGTTEEVLRNGWCAVEDIEQGYKQGLVSERVYDELIQAGLQSFQAVALNSGDQVVGILFGNYQSKRVFTEEDEQNLRSFAVQAAQVVRRAQQLDGLQEERKQSQLVPRMIELDKTRDAMQSMSDVARQVLAADFVTLYLYDDDHSRITDFVFTDGVHNRKRLAAMTVDDYQQLDVSVLERSAPQYIEDVRSVMASLPSPIQLLCEDEKVRSAVRIPLRYRDQAHGALFAGYHSLRRFTDVQRDRIDRLGQQIAAAISNASLYAEVQRQLSTFSALQRLSNVPASTERRATLESVVAMAYEMLASHGVSDSFGAIMLRNGDRLEIAAVQPSAMESMVRSSLPKDGLPLDSTRGITIEAFHSGESLLCNDVETDQRYWSIQMTIGSEMAAPIWLRDRVIGIINVEHQQKNAFTEKDVKVLELLASTLAGSLDSIYRLGQREAFLEASKVISAEINQTSDNADEFLARFLAEALPAIKLVSGCQIHFGSIRRYNQADQTLELIASYPANRHGDLIKRFGQKRKLTHLDKDVGVTGSVVLTEQSIRLDDVSQPDNHHYIAFNDETQSEIAVPLMQDGQVIGVLSAESPQLRAFDDEDVSALETIAELLVIAFQNIEQGDTLRRTNLLVDRNRDLALFNAISGQYLHSITQKAQSIMENVKDIGDKLASCNVPAVDQRLAIINRAARNIREKRMVRNVYDRDAVQSYSLNNLLSEHVKQTTYRFENIQFQPEYGNEDGRRIRCNKELMLMVVDNVLNNALNALEVSSTDNPTLTLTTQFDDTLTTLEICDNGDGISQAVREVLFKNKVPKDQDDKGMGIGLLTTKMIVESFGGDITFQDNSPRGTCMKITMPTEIKRSKR